VRRSDFGSNELSDDQYILGNTETASAYIINDDIKERVEDQFRRYAEASDCLDNIYITHSACGGTGSAMPNLIMNLVEDEGYNFTKYGTLPSPGYCDNSLEYFNSLCSISDSLSNNTFSIYADNERCFELLEKLGLEDPNYDDINKLLGIDLSMITAPLRYGSWLGYTEILSNLIPLPSLSLVTTSYSPLIYTPKPNQLFATAGEITEGAFKEENNLISMKNHKKIITAYSSFNGDITHQEAVDSCYDYRKENKDIFTEMSASSIKLELLKKPQIEFNDYFINDIINKQRGWVSLINSQGILENINNIKDKFKKFYDMRSYVHNYVGNGMDERQLYESFENIEKYISDFNSVDEDFDEEEIQ